MYLRNEEQAMYDGHQGPAVRRAIDLLLRDGSALSAERFIDTNKPSGTVGATTLFISIGGWIRVDTESGNSSSNKTMRSG